MLLGLLLPLLLLCSCVHAPAQAGAAPDLTGLASPAPTEPALPDQHSPRPQQEPSDTPVERHVRPEDLDDPDDPDMIDI